MGNYSLGPSESTNPAWVPWSLDRLLQRSEG